MTVLECRVGFQRQADILSLPIMHQLRGRLARRRALLSAGGYFTWSYLAVVCLAECMFLPLPLFAFNFLSLAFLLPPPSSMQFRNFSIWRATSIIELHSSMSEAIHLAHLLLSLSREVLAFCSRQLA